MLKFFSDIAHTPAVTRLLLTAWLALMMPFAHANEPVFATDTTSGALALAVPEFLPVEEAYQLTASIENNRVKLNWQLAPGYYLYQHRFAFFDASNQPIPVTLDYLPGVLKYDDYYEKELTVYYQQTSFSVAKSNLPASLQVESQACADAGLCYPPRRHKLAITGQHVDVSNPVPPTAVANQSAGAGTETETVLGITTILLFAFLGGAILNLMPCVFPVLSIKVMSVAASGMSSHSRHLHSITYTAGVVSAFLAIALLLTLLRSTGAAIGWGFQLQSPLFTGALVYLFTLMGLSFSGFFTVGTRLMNLGQESTHGHSPGASYMTGVLATVVASPCTAPFMGTALGFALTQSTATALLVFAFLGLGMATPFILLSWWPSLLRHLPAPGAWMERVKQCLAFPLYLSALWLLWVLGHQTDLNTVIALQIGIVLIIAAIWLHKNNPSSKGRTFKWALTIILITVAFALPWESYRNHQQAAKNGTIWEPFSRQYLNQLRADQQPVFVNLTADWCITCLANEKVALSSERFHQALRENGITYLKGDWTNYNPEITELLQENGREGVPLYLLYSRDGSDPVILPQLLTPGLVLDAIESIR